MLLCPYLGVSCGHLSNNGLGVFLNLGFPEVNSDMNIRVKEIYLRMILGNLVRMWGGVGWGGYAWVARLVV